MSRVLVILGMHRSGTSLIAQCCAAAGISAGPSESLLTAQSDNPAGFYENADLVRLNDRVLEQAGGSWYAPPAALQCGEVAAADRSGTSASCPDEAQRLLACLSTAAQGAPVFIKDPRLCLTWPFWDPFLRDAHILFVYRSPLPVARSLARRNRFPLQFGLALWELYNQRALSALAQRDHHAVSYEAVLSGETDLQALFHELADLGFSCDPLRVAGVVNSALDHADHNRGEDESLLLSSCQRRLHEHCVTICRSGSVPPPGAFPDEPELIARIRDHASALEPLARIVETGNERDEARALAVERTRERDDALAALRRLESDHDALAEAHAGEERLHAQAAATLQQLQVDHARLAAAHEQELSRHRALHEAHMALQLEHDARGQVLRAVLDERDGLQHALAQEQAEATALRDKADYLFFALTESYRSLLTFELSPMAAVQRQARRLYRLLTLRRGRNSAYEDVLERAHEHFSRFEIPLPHRPPSKWTMAGDVLRYVWRNPAGSARSFSWARLRRAVQVFFGSSSGELAVWVNARFPDTTAEARGLADGADDESLDVLELDFPAVDDPTVSIIVPVYNEYRVTVNCLRSVHRHAGATPVEILVADDCSTDLTATIADRMRGVRVVRGETNAGFLRNCLRAAREARGEYLLFLNNDTAVTEGWLEALLEPFADDRVGVTGPKLLFADGRLQEAGGIIWRDASGWNFGRADDPAKPAYNYVRDVDYVSGACLLIRRTLWDRIGGFDERFAPAYYEDADLCFAARAAGYRVVYQPRSVVYHFEGVSNGTDLGSGMKKHQVTNQAVFREKWHPELDAWHFPNAEHVVHARDRSAAKPCILVIDHYVPHHDKDAGGRSTYLYIRLLLDLGCRVQFMGANFFPHQPYTQGLQDLGVEVLVGESIARHLDDWFAEHAPYIDEILVHRPHVAEQFLPHLERLPRRPPISFFGHDLHYLRFQREAALKDDDALRREATRWQRRELAVCERVDRVYYFSDVEIAELAHHVAPDKLRRVPLFAMQLGSLPPYAPIAPTHLLFVGGFGHPPNVDAATWLIEDILPLVREAVPSVHVHLVGSNPTPAVLDLAGDSVTVHGYVSDTALADLYRQVGAAVVPLQYGAGVKGKVIEAVAHHVPLVTTDIGAEGIPEAEQVMWIENTAQAMARRLASILCGTEPVDERLARHESWLQQHFDARVATALLREDMPRLADALEAAA